MLRSGLRNERAERSVGLPLHHQVQRERAVARRDHATPAIGAIGRQRHGRCVTETMHARRRRGPLSRDSILIEPALERAGIVREREAELAVAPCTCTTCPAKSAVHPDCARSMSNAPRA